MAGAVCVQVVFNLIGVGSWNLFLSKEPTEGLGSATVALTGEHRTLLTRALAVGNCSVCKNPARTHRALRWRAWGRRELERSSWRYFAGGRKPGELRMLEVRVQLRKLWGKEEVQRVGGSEVSENTRTQSSVRGRVAEM